MMDQLLSNLPLQPGDALPVVPDSLRALCARQQHASLSAPAPVKVYMKRVAFLMRSMQSVIIDRQRPFRAATGNATSDPNEWSRLLMQFDAAVNQMRRAYVAFHASQAELRELPPLQEGQDYYEHRLPDFDRIMAEPFSELDAALLQWEAVTTKYLQMLQGTYQAQKRAA